MALGSSKRERCLMAANRVGKTDCACYEITCHLTGVYPKWWTGRKFSHPISSWAAGDTAQTVRDILQKKLFGNTLEEIGTGFVPGEMIQGRPAMKRGLSEAFDKVAIRHYTNGQFDGLSVISFKSYDQKRKSFQGDAQHIILLDEEPPADVYGEVLLRTMTTNGLVLMTFTPLMGITELVYSFMNVEDSPSRAMRQLTWEDAPHLTEQAKKEIIDSTPEYLRDARSKGIPHLGSGAIYPMSNADIEVSDFEIPEHWPKWYGMDVGWNSTACAFFTKNPETGTKYIYDVYKQGKQKPYEHAFAIKIRGEFLPGAIDPAARGRSQSDGIQLLEEYKNNNLYLCMADNSVETGIYRMWQDLTLGKLKIFKSCTAWFEEKNMYSRDEKGKVVKKMDHLMDATRYGNSTEDECLRMAYAPKKSKETDVFNYVSSRSDSAWMGNL